ncbi:MAG: NYN domain-containing protein [Alphaproteobacteria bacterium]
MPKYNLGLLISKECRVKGACLMGACAVYIDGGYLDKVLQHEFGNARICYRKLSKKIAGRDELLRAYYYHCLPYQSNPPTEEERARYASKHRFVTALKYLPRFDVRLGRLGYRGRSEETGEPIFQQKRVDIMLGVDMALLAGKGRISRAAILAGDSDFIPAIEVVKQEGVLTTLWHGPSTPLTRPSRELVEICDERIELTGEFIAKIGRAD